MGVVWEPIGERSSYTAEPLWTDPGLMSGIIARELVSTLKRKKERRKERKKDRKKKAQAGNNWSNLSPKSLHARKKPWSSLAVSELLY